MSNDTAVTGTPAKERIAAHEDAARELLPRPMRMLIGDHWVDATDAGRIEHVNPSTGRNQQELVVAGRAEIEEAIDWARQAACTWRATRVDERRQILLRIAAGVRRDRQRLATIGILAGGMTRSAALVAVDKCADFFEYYAGWTDKLNGAVVPIYPGRGFDYTTLEPYGVVLAMLNWNGPLTSTGRKVAAALAAGNSLVVKSPELAPFALEPFAEICVEAGLPPGTLNLLNGGPDVGAALVEHPGIDKISFTGSGNTARKVMAAAAHNLTPIALELGGKSANIVFADADLDAAAEHAAMFGVARGSGQGCLLPTRLLVQDAVHDAVVDRVVARLEAVRVGDPLVDAAAEMGPVISAGACERVLGVIRDAADRRQGTIVTGGGRVGGELADGFFVEPTVFTEVTNDTPLAREEIFGPVLSVIRFDDEAEAIEIANDSPFGLAGYVHTRDLTKAHMVADAIDAGYVSVNGFNPQPPTVPFGGNKQSGFGREGAVEGLHEFLRTKNTYVALG